MYLPSLHPVGSLDAGIHAAHLERWCGQPLKLTYQSERLPSQHGLAPNESARTQEHRGRVSSA